MSDAPPGAAAVGRPVADAASSRTGASSVVASAHVRVPCSTSNLGGGFDCLGIALERWLDATATLDGSDRAAPRVLRAGTLAALDGRADVADPHDDLLVRGVAVACAAAGRPLPRGLTLAATSAIPVARGLGSSAAALVAGALLGDALLGLGLGARRVAALCATEEGHPDNVAPMILGGAVLGVPNAASGDASPDAAWHFAPLVVHLDVAIALAIPAFETSTRAMRAALPATVPHRDAVRAAAKGAALAHGLVTGDGALLAHALDDVVHVPHRRALIPHYDAVVRAALDAGAWGATLSGAGSTLLALAPRLAAPGVAEAMAAAWRRAGIAADGEVARIAPGAVVAP